MKKLANTEVTIDKVLSERWSPRAFEPNFLIDEESIKSLMEAARWAPSCFGDQPWRFVLFEKSDATYWTKALNCLSVGNQNWAMDSSLLIAVCAHQYFDHNNELNRWAQYDTGAAAENICLQATSLGLKAHQMGGFDALKTKVLAAIPDDYDVMSFIAIGKSLQEIEYNDEQRERETAPRKRKPLEELYFINKWQDNS